MELEMRRVSICRSRLLLGLALGFLGPAVATAHDARVAVDAGGQCGTSFTQRFADMKVTQMFSCKSQVVAYSPWRKSPARACLVQMDSMAAITVLADAAR